jgi:hypothetical protein
MSDYQEYHSEERTPALSSSIVKVLATQSPRHAWEVHPLLNPNYKPVEKDEFDYGKAAHGLFLEGSEANLIVVEADDWRTKAAKELREQARAERKTAILARKLATVRKMVQAAHKFVEASEYPQLMKLGMSEQKIRWQEGPTLCMAKIDRVAQSTHNDMAVLADYKSTGDASPEVFSRQIARFGYDIQARFYQRGWKAATAEQYKCLGQSSIFLFLAQETDAPYACSWHALAPSMEEIADMRIERAISVWQRCMASGEWPGYDNRIHYCEAAAWQITQAEAEAIKEAA